MQHFFKTHFSLFKIGIGSFFLLVAFMAIWNPLAVVEITALGFIAELMTLGISIAIIAMVAIGFSLYKLTIGIGEQSQDGTGAQVGVTGTLLDKTTDNITSIGLSQKMSSCWMTIKESVIQGITSFRQPFFSRDKFISS